MVFPCEFEDKAIECIVAQHKAYKKINSNDEAAAFIAESVSSESAPLAEEVVKTERSNTMYPSNRSFLALVVTSISEYSQVKAFDPKDQPQKCIKFQHAGAATAEQISETHVIKLKGKESTDKLWILKFGVDRSACDLKKGDGHFAVQYRVYKEVHSGTQLEKGRVIRTKVKRKRGDDSVYIYLELCDDIPFLVQSLPPRQYGLNELENRSQEAYYHAWEGDLVGLRELVNRNEIDLRKVQYKRKTRKGGACELVDTKSNLLHAVTFPRSRPPKYGALKPQYKEVIEYLLEHLQLWDLLAKTNADGKTPLRLAIEHRFKHVIVIFMDCILRNRREAEGYIVCDDSYGELQRLYEERKPPSEPKASEQDDPCIIGIPDVFPDVAKFYLNGDSDGNLEKLKKNANLNLIGRFVKKEVAEHNDNYLFEWAEDQRGFFKIQYDWRWSYYIAHGVFLYCCKHLHEIFFPPYLRDLVRKLTELPSQEKEKIISIIQKQL